MIVQGLLDWLSQFVAGILVPIPPFPPEVQGALTWISDGMQYVGDLIAPLGMLIPFDALTAIVALWQALLVFWGGAMVVRLIIWLAGR